MARLITGDNLTMNHYQFGRLMSNMHEYITDEISQLGRSLSGIGRSFINDTVEMYNKVANSTSYMNVEAALNAHDNLWGLDEIQALLDITKIQNAPRKMVRYLMANPNVRELYQSGQCDGYGERYFDTDPTAIKEDHYEYQRVTDGVIFFDNDGGWEFTSYSGTEDDLYGESELTALEQFNILDAWELQDQAIEAGIDPTSKANNLL